MSQASKQVEWCLKKAKNEIEECKKLNKRPKHRGLLEINPDIEEAKKHIAKAEHDLKSGMDFSGMGYSDWSVSAFFYSMYHCFLAIAAKFGYESGNQTCTISLIEYLKEEGKINIDSKFIEAFKYEETDLDEDKKNSMIELREDYTYGIKTSANKNKIDELMSSCKELIDKTKEIVLG